MKMTPEHFFTTLYRKWKPEWKLSFFTTFAIGCAAYLFKFLNHLPNWDTFMDYYYPTNNMVHQGRQFQVIACAPSSFVDIPWITGLLCLLYIAIATILIWELLGIKKKSSIVLIAGLVVTFPTIISSFAYIYMADAFAVALLCAAAAVYVTQRSRMGFLAGAVILGFGTGVYQGFLSFAITLILLWIIKEVLFEQTQWKQIGKKTGHFLLMGILAMVFYYVTLRLCVWLEQIPLSGHQGMGSMHLPGLEQILSGVKNAYLDTVYFYIGSISHPTFYQVLNVLLLLCGGIGTIGVLCRITEKGKWLRILVFFLCICVYPCVCYLYYFMTEDVVYHTLMLMPLCLVYVYLIMLMERGSVDRTSSGDTAESKRITGKELVFSWLRWLPLVICALMVYNNAVTANISYRIMNESYQTTLNTMTRIVERMERLEDFEQAGKLAVFGTMPDSDSSAVTLGTDIVGVTEGQIITHQLHFVAMLDEYYHIVLTGCSEEELSELKNGEVYQSMSVWPKEGAVAMDGDVMMIRFE